MTPDAIVFIILLIPTVIFFVLAAVARKFGL